MLNQLKLSLSRTKILHKIYKISLFILAIYISFFVFSFLLTIFILIASYFTLKKIFNFKKENFPYTKNKEGMIEINPK